MSPRERGAWETAVWWLLIASCCVLLGGGCAAPWKPVILSGFVAWKEAPTPPPGEQQQRWVLVVIIPPHGRMRIDVPLRVFVAFQPGDPVLLRGATSGSRLRVEAIGKVNRPVQRPTPPARAVA